jgi:hypothetical protein
MTDNEKMWKMEEILEKAMRNCEVLAIGTAITLRAQSARVSARAWEQIAATLKDAADRLEQTAKE